MPLEVGQIVDHYRLGGIIARGKVTVVFSAFDLRLQRPVVLKVLDETMAADHAFRERFAREATTAARLGDHPRIVTVFDSNVVDGSLYFVTEFIEGMSLHDMIRARPPDPATVLRFLRQVAGALDYAHRHNAVHRDVNPANIMIKTSEEPTGAYLIDFGITKRLDTPGRTNVGVFVGTADYASPEQISVSPDVDRRADVCSLACTAFEALTGTQPYGSAPDDVACVAAHLLGPIPSAVARQPTLPDAVDDVFTKALAKDKHACYETCSEFVDALAGAFPAEANGEGPGATNAFVPPLPATAAAFRGHRAPPRRRRATVAAGVVAGALLAGGGGFLMWGRTSDARSAVPSTSPGVLAPVTGAATATAAAPATTVTTRTTTTPATTIAATTTTTTTTTTVTTTTTPSTGAVPSLTAARTRVVPIALGPPSTVLGPFGNVVGQPVTVATNSQSAVALALQARQLPGSIADVDTPTYFYAEWLRLTGGSPTTAVIASANGFVIDANGPADLNSFVVGTDGKVDTMSECAVVASCQLLARSIQISPNCQPGPDCGAFASNDKQMIAVLRATVNLRNPITTLIFSVTALNPVTRITDANNTVHFDPEAGWFSLTLPAGPPPGTESVVTVSFLDGSTSKLTVTYGE